MRELQALMATAEVERILNELGDRFEVQLPKHRKKQPQARKMQWRTGCAEIYFPPRIAEVAGRMKGVPLDCDTLQTVRDMGICFGY